MASPVVATHDIEVVGGEVVKRFRSWARGEHRREWRALTTLAVHAPGLAPAPLSCDLDSAPPHIRMSKVPGSPLVAHGITAASLNAAAAAMNRLHAAIPASVLETLPPQPWLAGGAISQLEASMAAVEFPDDADAVVRAALEAADHWLGVACEPDPGVLIPVFGQGDSNLANFLWDGHQVRLVDFEDSGRSGRAFELAIFVEHVSVWHDAKIAACAFLDLFELTTAEARHVLFFRRAFGLFWLLKLLRAGHGRRGTVHEQALRLLELLDRSEQ